MKIPSNPISKLLDIENQMQRLLHKAEVERYICGEVSLDTQKKLDNMQICDLCIHFKRMTTYWKSKFNSEDINKSCTFIGGEKWLELPKINSRVCTAFKEMKDG